MKEKETQEKLKAVDKTISKIQADHKILRVTVSNTQNDVGKVEKNLDSIRSELELKINSNEELLQLTAKQFEELKNANLYQTQDQNAQNSNMINNQ